MKFNAHEFKATMMLCLALKGVHLTEEDQKVSKHNQGICLTDINVLFGKPFWVPTVFGRLPKLTVKRKREESWTVGSTFTRGDPRLSGNTAYKSERDARAAAKGARAAKSGQITPPRGRKGARVSTKKGCLGF